MKSRLFILFAALFASLGLVSVTLATANAAQLLGGPAANARLIDVNMGVTIDGLGKPAVGSNYIYRIYYKNTGTDAATSVVLTQTLPSEMLYIKDTAEVSPQPLGNVYRWTFPSIPANFYGYFDVFLQVISGTVPSVITSTVQVAASSDSNPLNNSDTFASNLIPLDTYLSLETSAWTANPAPNTPFRFTTRVCNTGMTASNEVILVETLPAPLTVQSITTQPRAWAVSYPDTQHIQLAIPSIGGAGACQTVSHDVNTAGVAPGDELIYQSQITSTTDLSPDDNLSSYQQVVRSVHQNLSIETDWSGGVLTPGGPVRYSVRYQNTGNIPISGPILITDTFPAQTQYINTWNFPDGVQTQFSPKFKTTEYAVWELPYLLPGEGGSFEVELSVSSGTPGSILTNTATISPISGEDQYTDNHSQWVEALQPAGTNLRIQDRTHWNQSLGYHYAMHTLRVENVGSAPATGATITYTHATSMSLEAFSLDVLTSQSYQLNEDDPGQTVIRLTEPLAAREIVLIQFRTKTDSPGGAPEGLQYTHHFQVQANEADTNPADNSGASTLVTGPDLAVENYLFSPEPYPGDEVTFSIQLGNQQAKDATWWGTEALLTLTDVLPDGLIFKHAYHYDCEIEYWCLITPTVSGNQLIFPIDSLPAGRMDEIRLTAQVLPDIPAGSLLLNQATLESTNPTADQEYDLSNNTGQVYFTVQSAQPAQTDLALSMSVSHEPAVVNQELTYTLQIQNLGDQPAINISLNDVFPIGMIYQHHVGGEPCNSYLTRLECTLNSIPAGGSATIQLVLLPTSTGTFINSANLGFVDDTDRRNNAASMETTVLAAPRLEPWIYSVSPTYAYDTKLQSITIRGTNFASGAEVTLVDVYDPNISLILTGPQVLSANEIQAVVQAKTRSGTYHVVVKNPDGRRGVLQNAYTVLVNAPPQILRVSPTLGSKDRPVVMDVVGRNFAPNAAAKLVSSGKEVLPDNTIFVDSNHLRLVLPAGMAPEIYDLILTQDSQTASLPAAYQSFDPALGQDLLAQPYGFWVDPAVIHAGSPVTPSLGLVVWRLGGTEPLTDVVSVDFWLDAPDSARGGTKLGRQLVHSLAPHQRGVTQPLSWKPEGFGRYTLYAVIDPLDGVDELNEGNNVISRTLTVLPEQTDTLAPKYRSFTLNSGALTTSRLQVSLDLDAFDNVNGSGLHSVLYVEYEMDSSVAAWRPVSFSGWLPYTKENTTGYAWRLNPTSGMHYLQAWTIDRAGNISRTPALAGINYLPAAAQVGQGEVHVYRYPFNPGKTYLVRLTSYTGDADLYIWAPDNSNVVTDDTTEPVVEYSVTVPQTDTYQIEVEGATSAAYRLEIIPLGLPGMKSAQAAAPNMPDKARVTPYGTLGDSPTIEVDLPDAEAIFFTYLHLPLVKR